MTVEHEAWSSLSQTISTDRPGFFLRPSPSIIKKAALFALFRDSSASLRLIDFDAIWMVLQPWPTLNSKRGNL